MEVCLDLRLFCSAIDADVRFVTRRRHEAWDALAVRPRHRVPTHIL